VIYSIIQECHRGLLHSLGNSIDKQQHFKEKKQTIFIMSDSGKSDDGKHDIGSIHSSEAELPRRRSSLAAARESTAVVVHKIDDKLDAYERETVPDDQYKGFLSFLGLFTSRHTAGTEFAIGPLFVARGSSAIDILVGLFIGNFLATLSWRFIVAPLAISQRLTGE
jgi:hypothetical protein